MWESARKKNQNTKIVLIIDQYLHDNCVDDTKSEQK